MNLWRHARIICGLVMLLVACDMQNGDMPNANVNDNTADGNTNENAAPPPEEPASTAFNEAGFVFITGAIDSPDEVQIFDLGPLSAGDRLEVRCVPSGDLTLDPMIAVLDNDMLRVFWNDDVNPRAGNFIAAVTGNIRHASSRYFVAVTSSAFPRTTGQFDLTVQWTPNVDAPTARGQSVVLHYAAAEDVVVDDVAFGDLPAFDGANINDDFAGQTAQLEALILEVVQEDYADFNVSVLTTEDPEPQANFSTIYFAPGTADGVFSRADDVDFYNGNDMDNAIVFLGAFDGVTSNVDAMGQSLGNIVSREIGRLLGLMLADDVAAVMDRTESADEQRPTVLDDRSFGVSDLADFPIGEQDAPLLLQETVGLN